MKQPDKKSRITVGGVEYIWSVRTWPSWCWNFEDFNGLMLDIVLIEDRRRPLVVEFPMERKSGRPKPPKQMPPIPDEKIVHIIEQALELGWNPNSRGKPFLMDVDFHGN